MEEKKKKKMKLWHKSLLALIISIIVGIILSNLGGTNVTWINQVVQICDFLGNAYLRLLRLLSIPLILACIFNSVARLRDMARLRHLAIKSFIFFFITTSIAVTFGIIITNIIRPGDGFTLVDIESASYEAGDTVNIFDSLLNMVPENIFGALANGEAMQVIIFAILAGAAAITLGEKAATFSAFMDNLENIMFKITNYVLQLTPIGVLGLMTKTMTENGTKVVGNLLKFIACDWISAILIFLIMYTFMLAVIVKVNPFKFFAAFKEHLIIAISTLVSVAPMPLAMKTLEEKVGVPKDIAEFVLPIGATMNMNGTAVYFGVITMFTCQLMDVTFAPYQYVLLVLQSVLMAVSCATVPSLALVLSATLLPTFGLPLNGIGLVMGIHSIANMAHTPTNCMGCYVTATSIAASDGVLDREKLAKL